MCSFMWIRNAPNIHGRPPEYPAGLPVESVRTKYIETAPVWMKSVIASRRRVNITHSCHRTSLILWGKMLPCCLPPADSQVVMTRFTGPLAGSLLPLPSLVVPSGVRFQCTHAHLKPAEFMEDGSHDHVLRMVPRCSVQNIVFGRANPAERSLKLYAKIL